MNKFNRIKVLSLVLITMATACSNESITPEETKTPMKVVVVNDKPGMAATRAIITDAALPKGSEIGLTLVEEQPTTRAVTETYDSQNYHNIKYKAVDGGKWESDNVPLFSSTQGKTIAYYPYAADLHYSEIPIETASQTDYMYSGWVTGKNNANPDVEFTMKHALTAFRIVLKKSNDYLAYAKATAITVKGDGFVAAATMNAEDGALDDWSGEGKITVPVNVVDGVTVGHVLSETAQYTDIMAVPAEEAGTEIQITVAVEDANQEVSYYTLKKEYEEQLLQGSVYQITLKLTPKDLLFEGTTVTLWGDPIDLGDGEMEPTDDED